MALSIAGAPNFSLSEFTAKSYRPLSVNEIERAEQHASVLQDARDAVNAAHPRADGRDWRIRVTSYLRPADSSDHRDGAAVDWVVYDPNNGVRSDRFTKWARDWLAANRANRFDRLLWELDHVHHALRHTSRKPTNRPIILDQVGEDEDGKPIFEFASIIPNVDNRLTLSVVLVAGVGLWVLTKGI